MTRFFGMMPSNEVERQETHKDEFGYKVIIQAGPNGWSVIFADGSTRYKDEEHSTDENFNIAYDVAVDVVGALTPIKGCIEREEC